jgi:hypothetical protein
MIFNTRDKLEAINRLLEIVYAKPIRISDILSQLNLSPKEINELREKWVHQLCDAIINAVRIRFDNFQNGERDFFVLSKRIGFEGNRFYLQDIANELKLSRERIRQLEKRAIRKCKQLKIRHSIENNIKESILLFYKSYSLS